MALISEITEQLVEEMLIWSAQNPLVVPVGSPEALERFENFAKKFIAEAEGITPERIQLLALRFSDDKLSIVFNGYRILPKK